MTKDMNNAKALFSEPQMLEAAEAVDRGDNAKLQAMKHAGFDINQQGAKDGSTLLIWAILCRNQSAVKLLLDNGADPNRVPKESFTAMGWAASLEDPTFLKILLASGGNPNLYSYQKIPPIFDAKSSNRWKNVWFLLDHGADINALDLRTGETLAVDSMGGGEEHVYELLMRGANYTHIGYGGNSLAWSIAHDYVNPTLPAAQHRQKIKDFLIAHHVDLSVPQCGPPPPEKWPQDQKNDPKLMDSYKRCKAAGTS